MDNNQGIVVLRKEDLAAMYHDAAQIGAKAALDKLEEERKKQVVKVKDRRLHNTKLLLKNYRFLSISADNAIYSKQQIKECATDILADVMDIRDDEVIIESIKRSKSRTAIIVAHIDQMLSLYEVYCQQSKKECERRRYDIIFDYYISDEKMSIGQIADKMCLVRQTVYNDIKAAEMALSALLFGIDGIKIDRE